MRDYVHRCPQTSVGRIYADQGQLGRAGESDPLPEYEMMMRDARAGRFNLLLVSSVDRLAPSAVHTMGIVECLLDYGVSFKSLSGEFDLEGEPGKVLLGLVERFVRTIAPKRPKRFR